MSPSFPANLTLMLTFSLACGAAWVSLSYLFLVRFGFATRLAATAAAGVCATSAFLLYLSTQTLSEVPFALLVTLALWKTESLLEQAKTSRTREVLLGFFWDSHSFVGRLESRYRSLRLLSSPFADFAFDGS